MQPNVNFSNDRVKLLPGLYLVFLIIKPPELPGSNLHPNSSKEVRTLTGVYYIFVSVWGFSVVWVGWLVFLVCFWFVWGFFVVGLFIFVGF